MKHFQTNRRRFLKAVGNSEIAFPFLLNAGLLPGCIKRPSRPASLVRHHTYILKNGSVFLNGSFEKTDLTSENGVIAQIGKEEGSLGGADANVASKFLALGMSLEDVTEQISSRPRRLLTVESEIQIGRPMDLTIFSIHRLHPRCWLSQQVR